MPRDNDQSGAFQRSMGLFKRWTPRSLKPMMTKLGLQRRLMPRFLVLLGMPFLGLLGGFSPSTWAANSGCNQPLYLTLDTGHMGVAPFMAEVLNRQHVKVTFFVANEPTQEGDGTLGSHWQSWWQQRALEGHAFASHTMDHVYWLSDAQKATHPIGVAEVAEEPHFWVKPSAGPQRGQRMLWGAKRYCASIKQANDTIKSITSKAPLPLFRAPGGKTSPALLAASKACGYMHVGWSDAGFLGDELPSDRYPSEMLLKRALAHIKSGDILMAHLGIWSRVDPWATSVLEPLIVGLKDKGFCFKTLDEHPAYASWVAQHTQP